MDEPESSTPDTASDGSEMAASGEADGRSPARPQRRLLTMAVVLGALVLAVGLAFSQTQRASDAQDELDQFTHVRERAAAFGAAYLTYDAADVEASSRRLLELATEEFGADFEKSRTPGIEALFDQIGTSTEATTTDVFVSDISGDEARALVVVDVVASSTETPDQRLVDLTFVLDLVFEDGEWKVDAVNPAPRPDVVGSPTTTVPTTAPPTPPTATAPEG
jgi:hypothetical protein